MRIRGIAYTVMLSVGAAGLLAVFAPQEAAAIPAFSRQTGKSCTTCHSAFPKLNQTGQNFKTNGFRFPEDGEWNDVQDLKHVPLSAEIEVEAEFNKDRSGSGGAKTPQASQLKIDEIELLAGTPLGKTGRASGYGVVNFAEGSVGIGQAYAQVNDLLGATGHGMLNIKAGQFDIALPFLSHSQRVIKQRYYAQSQLGILGSRSNGGLGDGSEAAEFYNTAIEVNGQIVGKEATDLTHRYAVGIFQPQSLNDTNRLQDPGLYATYAVNFLENFNIGAIYKRDVVNKAGAGAPDGKLHVDKIGIAGDAKIGPFIATLGYFRSDANVSGSSTFVNARDLQNYMGEILFIPDKQFVVGARVDHIDQEFAKSGTRTTAMGRYNITSSVFFQLEYRVTDGLANATDGQRARAFLVALF
jgi:hypothetical protein